MSTDFERSKLAQRQSTGRTKVLNKAPAPLQITAEQIIREAHERRDEEFQPTVLRIADPEELAAYQLKKRGEFENVLRRQRQSIGVQVKYAVQEESQKEYDRVRSIYERALNVDYRNHTIQLRYAEFEMKNRFVNHARNVWDRACQLLPRVDQLQYKYALMEEKLGNMDAARTIFERQMKQHPPSKAQESYIKLEMRCGGERQQKLSRARKIQRRYTRSVEDLDAFMKQALWEHKNADVEHARFVYTTALEELGEVAYEPKFFIQFAKFEQSAKEIERARSIYKFALDNIPKQEVDELYRLYTSFEKQHGNRGSIDDVIVGKRRFDYEEILKQNPSNYDTQFDYLKLEQQNGEIEAIRELYERAIAQMPPSNDSKRFQRRYIYIFVRYALFEELIAKDNERCRQVYSKCIELIPHDNFTFAKIQLLQAKFEIRMFNVSAARKILGQALGKCPKSKIFEGYIELETKMLEFDRCRILYEKLLQYCPENCSAQIKYAEFEFEVDEEQRSRSIFELAISQEVLDMPELLQQKYIDFEISLKNYDNTRKLYNRLLERTKNAKVWISFAEFEASLHDFEQAREIYSQADEYFRQEGESQNAQRYLLLSSQLGFEQDYVDAKQSVEKEQNSNISELKNWLKIVQDKMPREVRRKKLIKDFQGNDAGFHEYIDYIFPDANKQHTSNLKLLAMAHQWKKKQKTDDSEMERKPKLPSATDFL